MEQDLSGNHMKPNLSAALRMHRTCKLYPPPSAEKLQVRSMQICNKHVPGVRATQ